MVYQMLQVCQPVLTPLQHFPGLNPPQRMSLFQSFFLNCFFISIGAIEVALL
jgi:hypothetical protein